jgi:hypothetical protein
MMERNHVDGGSDVKILLRDMKNAAVEGGATMGRWKHLRNALAHGSFHGFKVSQRDVKS